MYESILVPLDGSLLLNRGCHMRLASAWDLVFPFSSCRYYTPYPRNRPTQPMASTEATSLGVCRMKPWTT